MAGQIDRKLRNKKAAILQHAKTQLDIFSAGRTSIERTWLESLLFYVGRQWIIFDTDRLRYRRTNMRRNIPRPVTNRYGPTADAIVAMLTRFEPNLTLAPQTVEEDDLASALGGNRVLRSVELESGWQKRKTELWPWVVLTGNGWTHQGFDKHAGAHRRLIKLQCPLCGFKAEDAPSSAERLCPKCEEEGLERTLQVDIDPETGEPREVFGASGQMFVEVVSPFEMYYDNRIQELQDHQTLIRIFSKDVEWVRTSWPEQADKIGPWNHPLVNARIRNGLSAMNNVLVGDLYNENTTDLVEVYHRPDRKFPTGYYMLFSGTDLVLELHEYPFINNRSLPYFPFTHWAYNKVPGSFQGRTPMLDLVSKQRTRNRVESLIEMILARVSNPVWILPKPGVSQPPSGHPGEHITWDASLANNQPPQLIPGASIPDSVFVWLEKIDRDFDDAVGLSEIAQGQRPLSVRTRSAIDGLREVSDNRSASLLTNVAIATAEQQINLYELFRAEFPPERYFKMLGESANWTVEKITEADVAGGIDIWPEANQVLPKSNLERLATIEQFANIGALNLADPLVLAKLFRSFGIPEAVPTLGAEDAYIGRENDKFLRRGIIPIVSPFDNDQLHILRHIVVTRSEDFEQKSEQERVAFQQHIAEHQESMNAKLFQSQIASSGPAEV